MSCVDCHVLEYKIEQLETMVATLEQENRQQHARNTRLQEELSHAERIIDEYRESSVVMPMSYSKVKDSFAQ